MGSKWGSRGVKRGGYFTPKRGNFTPGWVVQNRVSAGRRPTGTLKMLVLARYGGCDQPLGMGGPCQPCGRQGPFAVDNAWRRDHMGMCGVPIQAFCLKIGDFEPKSVILTQNQPKTRVIWLKIGKFGSKSGKIARGRGGAGGSPPRSGTHTADRWPAVCILTNFTGFC